VEIKEYTPDEFKQSLVELYEGDPAGLATLVLQLNNWLSRGMRIAEYRNGMLSPSSYFDRRYLGYAAGDEMPREIPDSQGLSARYILHATVSETGWVLNLPTVLGELKIPRPAVAYINAGYDVNGADRKGWAIYRDQKLIEFVPEVSNEHDARLKELGADKEWATGEISVSEEVWEEITNEDNWPPSDPHKFSSHRAERLYGETLESFQDEDLGDSDWGWFALFKIEQAILNVDSQGFVSVDVYEDDTEMTRQWEELSEAWEQYNDEDEEDA